MFHGQCSLGFEQAHYTGFGKIILTIIMNDAGLGLTAFFKTPMSNCYQSLPSEFRNIPSNTSHSSSALGFYSPSFRTLSVL
jgi:hypothetical protein